MIESRAVWKDLESRRIRKSLEKKLGLGVMSRDNSSSWCTYIAEIKSMTLGYM